MPNFTTPTSTDQTSKPTTTTTDQTIERERERKRERENPPPPLLAFGHGFRSQPLIDLNSHRSYPISFQTHVKGKRIESQKSLSLKRESDLRECERERKENEI